MKLKYIIAALVAGLALLTSCEVEEPKSQLDEVQVSSSYVALSQQGGSTSITLTATDNWQINEIPEWLTVSPASGAAGEVTVTFSAEAAVDGRTATVLVDCAEKTQYINVIQGLPVISPATCAEVINGIEGKTYLVTGICTGIANTQYGNFYLNDGTGELYIYGTVNAQGKYDWASFGIEVGDEVTVQGARVTYGSTIEFVDALFISVNKSLIKVDSTLPENAELSLEGGELVVNLVCKGKGVSVEVPEQAKSWLSIASVDGANNTVTFAAAPNAGGDRSVTVVFKTTDGKKDYTAELKIFQKGAIIETTADVINAAADGDTQYRITGCVSSIANDKYGNLYLKDYTGEVYVYGSYDLEGNRFDAFPTPVNQYDIITVVGPKTSYKDAPQMKNVTVENHIPVTSATVADFLAAEEAGDVYYSITGTVANIVMDKEDPTQQNVYGNFDIVDETGSVYVYGLLSGWGGPSKQFRDLGLVEGDVITIVGVRSGYKGTPQVGSAFFVSKAE